MNVPLFLQDYQHLDERHIDYDTTNISFLKMYRVLQRMGVKNNKFHLLLLDPDLRGINPHDLTDDSMELKLRIIKECKLNPWYAFRNVIRVPASGTDGVPFEMKRSSLSMIWLFFNHVDNLLIMPRQQGKTIGATSLWAYILYILGFGITVSMLAKDDKLRKENVDRLRDIRDNLPLWMVHRQRIDIDSREEVSYEVLRNKYQTYVAQSSTTGAEKLGRGMTTPIQHWDEVAFFSLIHQTYPIALSSTSAAIESTKAVGAPYGNILTTTAGKLNTPEGQFTHSLLCDAFPFTETLYDLPSNRAVVEMVKSNSKRGIVYSEFNYMQLGKTREWYENEAARLGDEDVVARDLRNEWTMGSKESPIEKHLLDKIYASRKEPEFIQKIDEFILRWYIPKSVVLGAELAKIPIVIGGDASANVGRDFTSFVFTDARNLKPLATCSCNTTNIIKVALFICKWLKCDNVLFIPERNHVGSAIIDYCLLHLEKQGVNPFWKIYNEIVQEWRSASNKLTRAELNRPGISDQYRKRFGFTTNSQTRPFLYKTVFRRVLETAGHLMGDMTLINQIGGLTVRNGRIDHSAGGNDDSVLAYMLSGWMLLYGDNLDMYSFNGGSTDGLLADILIDETTGDSIDLAEIERKKQEIVRLEKFSKREGDPTKKIDMLQRLNRMKEALPKTDTDGLAEIQSISQLQGKSNLPVPDDYRRSDGRYLVDYLRGLGGLSYGDHGGTGAVGQPLSYF